MTSFHGVIHQTKCHQELVSLTPLLARRFVAYFAKPVPNFYLQEPNFEDSTYLGLGGIEHSHPAFSYPSRGYSGIG
jgi:hypothetical protein